MKTKIAIATVGLLGLLGVLQAGGAFAQGQGVRKATHATARSSSAAASHRRSSTGPAEARGAEAQNGGSQEGEDILQGDQTSPDEAGGEETGGPEGQDAGGVGETDSHEDVGDVDHECPPDCAPGELP